ncbi:MAG: flagellin, partial [Schwartzia sp.]|nr:flagellin [Schwartzia sp. (in: firmicutes)]
SNIVVQQENTTASESTIRDADMAKEMAEYTKASVLSQASQSMLAQANQNGSAILSLLQ